MTTRFSSFHAGRVRITVGLVSAWLAAAGPASPGTGDPIRIPGIQGRGHTSPLAGQAVEDVRGVVVAVDPAGEDGGFWMVDPAGDGDDATSDGIFVLANAEVSPGDAVSVNGTVAERAREDRPGDLTVTMLRAASVTVGERRRPPPAVRVGRGGRRPPAVVIDDDGLESFDPELDGIDFWESLEGMVVTVEDALVVGATTHFGDLVVVADGGIDASGRTRRGGLRIRPGDANPERLAVGSRLLAAGSAGDLSAHRFSADVGDRFAGPITGVLDYDYGQFKILPREVPELIAAPAAAASAGDETTELTPGPGRLTVASFNVYNLSARTAGTRFADLARVVVDRLRCPDVLALQEIQDNNGPQEGEDGVVDASRTLTQLIEAIAEASGPTYDFRQVDPEGGSDGGQPGGNIRVAFLFQPARVSFVDRVGPRVAGHRGAGPHDATAVEMDGGGPRLTLSPGRIAPDDPSFTASRKPLAGEFLFAGRKVFLIVVHLASKRGDDPLFGHRQPPVLHTELRRNRQALVVHRFAESVLDLDPEARVVILGDMNELDFRSPMRILVGSRWTDLVEGLPADDRYTYVFNGNAQVIDHVVVSPSLAPAAEVDIVHIHADRSFDRRASDHDPVVVRLALE